MTPAKLAKFMQKYGKNAAEVAVAIKVNPKTIERFLGGKNIQPIVNSALDRWAEEVGSEDPPKTA